MILQIKEIPGFSGYYIDNQGVVYTTRRPGQKGVKTILTPRVDRDGYHEVALYRNGKRYFRRVHRLVAKTFIPNPKKLPQINHRDGDKQNNKIQNLMWCTPSENSQHAYRVLNRKMSGCIGATNIPIRLTSKKTGKILIFDTIRDCARHLDMSHEHLGRILKDPERIKTWRKRNLYEVEYYNSEDVTTIPKGSSD